MAWCTGRAEALASTAVPWLDFLTRVRPHVLELFVRLARVFRRRQKGAVKEHRQARTALDWGPCFK